MKDYQDLLNDFNSIDDLPISEEMLGAYIEGNLSDPERMMVEEYFENDSALNDLLIDTISSVHYDDDDFLMDAEMTVINEADFDLPQVHDDTSVSNADDFSHHADSFLVADDEEQILTDVEDESEILDTPDFDFPCGTDEELTDDTPLINDDWDVDDSDDFLW